MTDWFRKGVLPLSRISKTGERDIRITFINLPAVKPLQELIPVVVNPYRDIPFPNNLPLGTQRPFPVCHLWTRTGSNRRPNLFNHTGTTCLV